MSSNFKEKSQQDVSNSLNDLLTNCIPSTQTPVEQQSSIINTVFEQLQKFKETMTQKGELELLKEKIMQLEQRNSELEKKLSSSSNLNNSSSSTQSKSSSLNESLNDDSLVLTKPTLQQQSTPIPVNPPVTKPAISASSSSSLNSIPNINQGGFIITSSGTAILVPPMGKNSATTSTPASSSSATDETESLNSNIDLTNLFKTNSPSKVLKSSPVKPTQASNPNIDSNLNPTAFIISNGQLVPVITSTPNHAKVPIQPKPPQQQQQPVKKTIKPKQVKAPKPSKPINVKPIPPVIAPAPIAPPPVIEPKKLAPCPTGVKKPREIRPKPSQATISAPKIAIQPVPKTISLVTPIKLNTEVESNDILSKAASMIFSPNEFQTLNTLSPNHNATIISPGQVNTLLTQTHNTQEQFTIVPLPVVKQPVGKVAITRNPKKVIEDKKQIVKPKKDVKKETNSNLNLIDTNLVTNLVDLDAALSSEKKDRSKSPDLMSMPTLEQFFELELAPKLNTSNENNKKSPNKTSSPKKKLLPKVKENDEKLKFDACDLDKVLDQLDTSETQPAKQKDFLLDLLQETAQNISTSSDASSNLSLTNIAMKSNEKSLSTPVVQKKPKIAPKPPVEIKPKVKATSLSDSDDNDDIFDLLDSKKKSIKSVNQRTPLKPDNHQTVKKRGRPPKALGQISKNPKLKLTEKSKSELKSDTKNETQNDDENSNFLADTFQELIEQKSIEKQENKPKETDLLTSQNLIEDFNNFEYDLAGVSNEPDKNEDDDDQTEELTIASLTSKNLNRKRSRTNIVQKSVDSKIKRVKVDEQESESETDISASDKSINEENGKKRKRGRPKSVKKVTQSGQTTLLQQSTGANIEYAGLTRFEIPFEEDPFSESKNESKKEEDESFKKQKIESDLMNVEEKQPEKVEEIKLPDPPEPVEEVKETPESVEDKDLEETNENFETGPIEPEKPELTTQFNWDNSNQPSHYDLENDPILNNDLQLIHSTQPEQQVKQQENRTQMLKTTPIIMTPPSTVSSVSSISSLSTQNQQSLSINPSSTSSNSSTQMISPVSLPNNDNLQQRSSSVEPNYNQNYYQNNFYNQNFYPPPVNRNSSPQMVNYQQRPNSVLNTSQSPQANRVSLNSTPTPTTPTPQMSTTPSNFNNLNRSKSNSNSNLVNYSPGTNNNNNSNVNMPTNYNQTSTSSQSSLPSSKSFDHTNGPTISFMHQNNSNPTQLNTQAYEGNTVSTFHSSNYQPTSHQIYPSRSNNYLTPLQLPGLNPDPFSINKNLTNLSHLNHFPPHYNEFIPTIPPIPPAPKPNVPPAQTNPVKNETKTKPSKTKTKSQSQSKSNTTSLPQNASPASNGASSNPPANYAPNKYDQFIANPVTNVLHSFYANSKTGEALFPNLFPKPPQQTGYPGIPGSTDPYVYQKTGQNEIFYGQNGPTTNRSRSQTNQIYPNPQNYTVNTQGQSQSQHQSNLYQQHQQYQQANQTVGSNPGVNYSKTNGSTASNTQPSRSSSNTGFDSSQGVNQRNQTNNQNLYLNQNNYGQMQSTQGTQPNLTNQNQTPSNNQQYRFPANGNNPNLYHHSTHQTLAHHLNANAPGTAALAAAFSYPHAAMSSYLANQLSVPHNFQWHPQI